MSDYHITYVIVDVGTLGNVETLTREIEAKAEAHIRGYFIHVGQDLPIPPPKPDYFESLVSYFAYDSSTDSFVKELLGYQKETDNLVQIDADMARTYFNEHPFVVDPAPQHIISGAFAACEKAFGVSNVVMPYLDPKKDIILWAAAIDDSDPSTLQNYIRCNEKLGIDLDVEWLTTEQLQGKVAEGDTVIVVTNDQAKAERLQAAGCEVIVASGPLAWQVAAKYMADCVGEPQLVEMEPEERATIVAAQSGDNVVEVQAALTTRLRPKPL